MSAGSKVRRSLVAGAVGLGVLMTPAVSTAAPGDGPRYTAGASGASDPYFPFAGNGGYDVQHYDLDITYAPPAPAPAPLSGEFEGVATIELRATQDLDRFNLDLRGMDVHRVMVNGRRAAKVARDQGRNHRPDVAGALLRHGLVRPDVRSGKAREQEHPRV